MPITPDNTIGRPQDLSGRMRQVARDKAGQVLVAGVLLFGSASCASSAEQPIAPLTPDIPIGLILGGDYVDDNTGIQYQPVEIDGQQYLVDPSKIDQQTLVAGNVSYSYLTSPNPQALQDVMKNTPSSIPMYGVQGGLLGILAVAVGNAAYQNVIQTTIEGSRVHFLPQIALAPTTEPDSARIIPPVVPTLGPNAAIDTSVVEGMTVGKVDQQSVEGIDMGVGAEYLQPTMFIEISEQTLALTDDVPPEFAQHEGLFRRIYSEAKPTSEVILTEALTHPDFKRFIDDNYKNEQGEGRFDEIYMRAVNGDIGALQHLNQQAITFYEGIYNRMRKGIAAEEERALYDYISTVTHYSFSRRTYSLDLQYYLNGVQTVTSEMPSINWTDPAWQDFVNMLSVRYAIYSDLISRTEWISTQPHNVDTNSQEWKNAMEWIRNLPTLDASERNDVYFGRGDYFEGLE